MKATPAQWHDARSLLTPALDAFNRVDYVGMILVDETLRSSYNLFVSDIRKVIYDNGHTPSDAPFGVVLVSTGKVFFVINDV